MRLQLGQCLVWLVFLCGTCEAAGYLAANSLSIKNILGSQASAQGDHFKQVLKQRKFQFPQDHLAHQAYKTEWWYFTGNVSADSEQDSDVLQKFAYQFTLFRFSLRPEKLLPGHSQWRSDNIYMAHVALTDINNQQFYQQERFSRDGLDLAGAGQNDSSLLKFWLNNWQIQSLMSEQLFPLKLTINDENFAVNLHLEAIKPMVLQGHKGFSQKNTTNASYYYSYTRLASKGSIRIGKKTYPVSGNSWFDREWSTSTLGEEQQGWDWLALHLDDGSDLMLYQMRKKDGTKDTFSSGILVDSQGKSETIASEQFQFTASEFWRSPTSGIRYPIEWMVLIPEKKIKLTILTPVKQQEWSEAGGFSFNYWEGSVKVHGSINQEPASGSGYLEMTGYD